MTSGSTMERLRAAEAAGTLEGPEARTLMEAFGFIFSLRLDHQVEQLRRGETPDDFIDPKTLNPLARSYLREAFRAVASVQPGWRRAGHGRPLGLNRETPFGAPSRQCSCR